MYRSAALLFLGLFSALAADAPARAPVLVELFTSEGCSSCPPADQLLGQLDSRAIVLGEHVDYWDRYGWRDRFSSTAFTVRQENYGKKFHIESVYTPQMVVDGAVQFSGADSRRAVDAIDRAARNPKAKIQLSRGAAGLDVSVEDSPQSASVYLAFVEPEATTQVGKGENQGRELHHVAVARGIRKIGAVKRGGGFQKTVELPADSASQRLVVFLQDGGDGDVFGAALIATAAAAR